MLYILTEDTETILRHSCAAAVENRHFPRSRTVRQVMPRRYDPEHLRAALARESAWGWFDAPPPAPMTDADYTDGIVAAGRALADAASTTAGDTPVPTCPGWDVDRLIAHVGATDRWVASIVRNRAMTPPPRQPYRAGRPEPYGERIAWLRTAVADVAEALASAAADAQLWAPGTGRPVRFWARRMMHEHVLHGADVGWAVGEAEPHVRHRWARDGIGEFLDVLPGAVNASGRTLVPDDGDNRPVHIAFATADTREVWRVVWQPPAYTWTVDHVPAPPGSDSTGWSIDVAGWAPELVADAAAWLSGRAADVYLWLWGRPANRLVDDGDETVLDRWRSATRIATAPDRRD
jgi:uncharacterized protein (TIGR03083 family)